MARRLRMQYRAASGVEPEMAGAAARRSRLASQCNPAIVADNLRRRCFTIRQSPAMATSGCILNRTAASQQAFFEEHCLRTLSQAERITALKLMEMERHLQLMYTSCGWFFDDLAGIETVQVISYAGRVLQLAAEVFGAPGEELEERLPFAA